MKRNPLDRLIEQAQNGGTIRLGSVLLRPTNHKITRTNSKRKQLQIAKRKAK